MTTTTRRVETWTPSPAVLAACQDNDRRLAVALEAGDKDALTPELAVAREVNAAAIADHDADLAAGRLRDIRIAGSTMPAAQVSITPAVAREIDGIGFGHSVQRRKLMAAMVAAKNPADLGRRRFMYDGLALVADLVLLAAEPPRWVIGLACDLAAAERAALASGLAPAIATTDDLAPELGGERAA